MPTHPAFSPVAGLRCAGVSAAHGTHRVLDDVTAEFAPGRLTAVIGPNGSGKSTLLSCLAAQHPHSGHVSLHGRKVSHGSRKALARELAFLPQAPLAPEGVTVRGLVERGRSPHRAPFTPLTRLDHAAVDSALARLALTSLEERRLTELSGGQRQRAWLALVLAQNSHTILLDEPTAFLDLAHQVALLDLARSLAAEGRTVVAVLHDLNLAAAFADDLLIIHDGRVRTFGSPAQVISAEMLAEVFALQAQVMADPVTGAPVILPRPAVSSVQAVSSLQFSVPTSSI